MPTTPPPQRNAKETLVAWGDSLAKTVDIGGLFTRNKIAHKWKATFLGLSLREGVAWRTQDLLSQSMLLYESSNVLGARILLRSAFESVAVLIYLNQLTRKVLAGSLNFHEYSEKTRRLLLGSRDKSTQYEAINILSILEKCNQRYPGMMDFYAKLSESAHPNYQGTTVGYSDIDRVNYVTKFSNKWVAMYGKNHLEGIELCMFVFDFEYNREWKESFEKLEQWLVQNDAELEATKGDAAQAKPVGAGESGSASPQLLSHISTAAAAVRTKSAQYYGSLWGAYVASGNILSSLVPQGADEPLTVTESASQRISLTAGLLQSIPLVEHAISSGFYWSAAALLRQHMEALARIIHIRNGQDAKAPHPPNVGVLPFDLAKNYGRLSEFAHLSRGELLGDFSASSGGADIATYLPEYREEWSKPMLAAHIRHTMTLVTEIDALHKEMYPDRKLIAVAPALMEVGEQLVAGESTE